MTATYDVYDYRATCTAHDVTKAASGIRAYNVDELLKSDAHAYCLDAPQLMPAGSLRGYTNLMSGERHIHCQLLHRP